MDWEAITIDFVETTTGGGSLYCVGCGAFHDRDSFSAGRHGQRLAARPRYCTKGKPAVDNFIVDLSHAATIDGARRCGVQINNPPPADVSAAAQRAAVRAARSGPPQSLQTPTVRRAPAKKRRTTRVSAPKAPQKSATHRLNALWSSTAGIIKTKLLVRRKPKGRRREAGAVLLPSCERRQHMLAELERLLLAGVRRKARPRKLHLTLGLVEFVTNALLVPKAGTLICGQAALESATGLSLDALGVERWQPSLQPSRNLLSFAGMNEQLQSADAAGTAFVLRKPLRLLNSATDAFGCNTGVFVITAYHLPGDEFEGGVQLPYGAEVMGCRCGLGRVRLRLQVRVLNPAALTLVRGLLLLAARRSDCRYRGARTRATPGARAR